MMTAGYLHTMSGSIYKTNNMKQKARLIYYATRGGYVYEQKVTTERTSPTSVVTQELYLGQPGNPVEAIPKPDTIFSGWSDGVKSNPRTDTAGKEDIEAGAREIFANFVMKPWWEKFIDWIWGRRSPFQSKY
jgi:hypothetical protein